MMVTKLGVNHMLEKKIKGSIINIGSVAALRGFAAGKLGFHKDKVEHGADTLLRRCCLYLIEAWSCRLDKKHSCVLHGKGYPVQCCPPVRNGDQHLQYHQKHKRRRLSYHDEGTRDHGQSQGGCSDRLVPGLRCLEHSKRIMYRYRPWLCSFLIQASRTPRNQSSQHTISTRRAQNRSGIILRLEHAS
jgi:hypothetical protein